MIEYLRIMFLYIFASFKRCISYAVKQSYLLSLWLVGWLCFTSHRQRGHLQTAPPFIVPCERREAHISNPGRRVAVHYTTAAPRQLLC